MRTNDYVEAQKKYIGGAAMCGCADVELVHLSLSPFVATCGADRANQRTTTVRENVTCLCCLGQHVWVGKQLGGPPDMAESCEWVEYCKLCSVEKPGSFVE